MLEIFPGASSRKQPSTFRNWSRKLRHFTIQIHQERSETVVNSKPFKHHSNRYQIFEELIKWPHVKGWHCRAILHGRRKTRRSMSTTLDNGRQTLFSALQRHIIIRKSITDVQWLCTAYLCHNDDTPISYRGVLNRYCLMYHTIFQSIYRIGF